MPEEFGTVNLKQGAQTREIELLRRHYRTHRDTLSRLISDAPTEHLAAEYQRLVSDIDMAVRKLDELEGTPDWVLEVVSKSSVTKDTQLLRGRYFRAGIPEYWLVNARGKEIDFQILIRGGTDYIPSATVGDWQRSRVFLRKFRLMRRRGRMNFWEYTLRVKSLR